MQVLSPSTTTAYSGVLRNTYQIASGEGFFSLWRGMSSVIVGAGKIAMLPNTLPFAIG